MDYTFGFTFKKLSSTMIGANKSHNLRLHSTSSQLTRKEAWITPQGHHTIVAWDDAKIELARGLAKRKDAVVVIAFSIQLGAQTDWRAEPTEAFPEGKPKPLSKDVINGLHKGAKEWAREEFGEDNLVSVELHTDESTPHVQLVVTPVNNGKLQAKHWLDGSGTCAKLRRRACDVMNRYVKCHYVPGNPGGKPHDPGLSAESKAPNKNKAFDLFGKQQNAELQAQVEALTAENRQLKQALFSRKKTQYLKDMIETAQRERDAAVAEAAAAKAEAQEARADRERAIDAARMALKNLPQQNEALTQENQSLCEELAQEREKNTKMRSLLERAQAALGQTIQKENNYTKKW